MPKRFASWGAMRGAARLKRRNASVSSTRTRCATSRPGAASSGRSASRTRATPIWITKGTKKYGDELEALARASFSERGLEDMAEFFKTRAHLLTEHSMGWMLLKCLRMEMQGDTSGMKRAAKTGYALKSILDFAEAGKKPMKDAARPFFNRLAEEPRVFAEYTAAYEDYCAKLRERAVAKKREEEEEASKEEKSLEEIPREQRLGPGGLDPVEVFESLPEAMRDAFESGSVDALRDYVNALPMAEARTHMRRMVDSGLWVATPGQEGTALRDPEDPGRP